MDTYTFDDGSTISVGADGGVSATPTTDYAVNRQGAVWTPQSVNPAANSWEDVLKFGMSRLIDAKVRPVVPNNTLPYYQNAYSPPPPAFSPGGAGWAWLILGAVAVAAVIAFK